MRKKITSVPAFCVIGVFLLCLFTACSPWKQMKSWLPFRGDDQSQYSLTDKDIEKFSGAIKSTNSDAESHYRLACFYQERKKHRLAIEEFKKALQNNPADVKAYNGIGVSYDLLGEFPRAIKAYEAALRLDPKLAYVYNNLGYSYLLQKKLDSAINAFQQAVALDKENSQYHNNLGLAYGKEGKYDLAFNEFKRAGNEEKARCHMAQLFNQKPGMYSTETLVAENLPQNGNQDAGKEKPAQTALIDQGIREENIAAAPSTNLLPENNTQSAETKAVVSINKNLSETKAVLGNTVKTSAEARRKPDRVDKTQGLGKQKSQGNRQIFAGDLEIEISNGNGINHFAKMVGCYLAKKGFKVTSLKNEPHFNNRETKIYYCEGGRQDAYFLAKQIPRQQDMIKVTGFKNRNIKIRIVIGKDMVSYYKNFKTETLRSL